jgi:hypothetical protein
MSDDISVFEVDVDAEFVWMRHGDGQPAAFPRGSVDAWQVKGWFPCEAPPDVDPALAEHVPPAAAAPAGSEPQADEPAGAAGDNHDDSEEMNSDG